MKLFFNVFVLCFISLSLMFAESEYEKAQKKAAKKAVKNQIDAIENAIILDVLFDDKPKKKRDPALQLLIDELKKGFHKEKAILKEKFKESKKILKESKENKEISKKAFKLAKEKLIIDEELSLKDLRIKYRLEKETIIQDFKLGKKINKKTQKQIKKTVKRKKELNDAKEIYDLIK